MELNYWLITQRTCGIRCPMIWKVPSLWIISIHYWENGWVQLVIVQCVRWWYKSWTYYIKLYVMFACKRILFRVHMCVIYIHNWISASFVLFYFVYLIFISIFRVANQIPIIHMGRSQRWDCLVICFYYQLMARLGGRMVVPSWPGPCEISQNLVIYSHKMITHLCIYTAQKKVLGHSLLCRLHGNHQIWNAIFRQPNVVAWWKFAWLYAISSSLRKPCCWKYNRYNIHIFIA